MSRYVLAIDQGTTSTRAILFDQSQNVVSQDQQEFPQFFPADGQVEHDAEDIWRSVIETCQAAMLKAGASADDIAAIGITNQRETTLVWDKQTGVPIHHAIVWQDRRTSEYCANLKAAGSEEDVRAKTGLLLDPYFSATKLRWLLENVDGAAERAASGDLLFGTIDTFLIWRLTGGKSHKTDATNASRTLLFNIHTQEWDDDLLKLFEIPRQMLPEVCDCADDFGQTINDLFGGSIPITGVAGDQHAATIGQACFKPGMIKSTYGTGCFAMLNTGDTPAVSKHRLLTTVAYRLNGHVTYGLEGSIFIAGAAVQWLRDGLRLFESASETGALAAKADPSQNVILVPAFAGLGAPYWNPNVRAAMFGMTRATGAPEFAKAALEAVCFQTRDLIEAMSKDYDFALTDAELRVDGGMVASDWTMQFLSDVLHCPVDRPVVQETTALGAAWLAASKTGLWPTQSEFADAWRLDRQFLPAIAVEAREQHYARWRSSVSAAIAQNTPIPHSTDTNLAT